MTFFIDHFLATEIEDFVKDGISKNAKNQISFNNFIQAEHKKSQMNE